MLDLDIVALVSGLQTEPLPPARARDPAAPHAPARCHNLTCEEKRLAVRNALRYFPPRTHATLAPEFAAELEDFGKLHSHRWQG